MKRLIFNPILLGSVVSIVFVLTSGQAARAGLSLSSSIEKIAKPSQSRNGDLQSDTHIRLWKESSGVLSQDVAIDHDGSVGTFSQFSDLSAANSSQSIAKGTHYASYMVHLDPIGDKAPTIRLTGSITFDRKIMGVILKPGGGAGGASTLSDSDFLTAGTLTEGTTPTRGLEMTGGPNDSFTISDDGRTLTFNLLRANSNELDEMRILLTSTPEPTTIAVWSMIGIGGIIARRRMKKRQE